MCTQLPHIATLEICMFYDNDNNDDDDNDDDDDGFFRPEIIRKVIKYFLHFWRPAFNEKRSSEIYLTQEATLFVCVNKSSLSEPPCG